MCNLFFTKCSKTLGNSVASGLKYARTIQTKSYYRNDKNVFSAFKDHRHADQDRNLCSSLEDESQTSFYIFLSRIRFPREIVSRSLQHCMASLSSPGFETHPLKRISSPEKRFLYVRMMNSVFFFCFLWKGIILFCTTFLCCTYVFPPWSIKKRLLLILWLSHCSQEVSFEKLNPWVLAFF